MCTFLFFLSFDSTAAARRKNSIFGYWIAIQDVISAAFSQEFGHLIVWDWQISGLLF